MKPGLDASLFVRAAIRRFILMGTALFLLAGMTAVPPAYGQSAYAPTTAQALRLTLPTPTGQKRVGVVQLHLVDRGRPDPWVSSQPVRELMVSVWYPAKRPNDRP